MGTADHKSTPTLAAPTHMREKSQYVCWVAPAVHVTCTAVLGEGQGAAPPIHLAAPSTVQLRCPKHAASTALRACGAAQEPVTRLPQYPEEDPYETKSMLAIVLPSPQSSVKLSNCSESPERKPQRAVPDGGSSSATDMRGYGSQSCKRTMSACKSCSAPHTASWTGDPR